MGYFEIRLTVLHFFYFGLPPWLNPRYVPECSIMECYILDPFIVSRH